MNELKKKEKPKKKLKSRYDLWNGIDSYTRLFSHFLGRFRFPVSPFQLKRIHNFFWQIVVWKLLYSEEVILHVYLTSSHTHWITFCVNHKTQNRVRVFFLARSPFFSSVYPLYLSRSLLLYIWMMESDNGGFTKTMKVGSGSRFHQPYSVSLHSRDHSCTVYSISDVCLRFLTLAVSYPWLSAVSYP